MKRFFRTIRNLVLYWIPPILWMGFIFFLSSQQRVSVTHTYVADFTIFKSLHMIEYAILYFLFFRAVYATGGNAITKKQKLIYPIILSVLFAISDEAHQLFTPTREGQIKDVIIDSVGILLMYEYVKRNLEIIKKLI